MMFVRFLEGKWSQVEAKIESNIVLILKCVKKRKTIVKPMKFQ